jgi:UDP-N-acetylglucosamine transferase subunit ALG13
MIFVTVGTHVQFNRLVKRIDELAPNMDEKIIIQRGSSSYIPKNCESFDWDGGLDKYMKKARLIITHGGLSSLEAIKDNKKPTIIVPRQYRYGEHINDHQVEFGKVVENKCGAKVVYDIKDLNLELLRNYAKVIKIKDDNLNKLQSYIESIIKLIDN